MSNDKTTLADAQPGGRVRLWDQAALRRLHAHLTAYPPPCNPEDVHVLGAALSVQPSTGGQGAHDCLASTLGDLFLRGWIDDVSGKLIGEAARKDMAAALAARQPVVAVPQGCDACERTGIRQNDEGRNVFCPSCDLGRACAGDAGQPAGEPTIWVSPAQLSAHKDRVPGDGGAYLPARLTRDGQFTKPLYAAPAQAVDLAPRPMDTAPTDGTLVRLMVDFTSNATEDTAGPAWTIGSNNDGNVMADERVGWQFAGWCWTHDHFTEGEGTPVGWLPLVGEAAQAVDLGSPWVSVNDRLPSEEDYGESGDVVVRYRYNAPNSVQGEWDVGESRHDADDMEWNKGWLFGSCDYAEVSHWMPKNALLALIDSQAVQS